MSTCVKTFTFTTWQDAFAAHVNNIYPNSNTSALCLQHIRVFTAWHSAKFNQELNPQNLTNYDLILYRHHSLTEEKVSAATWNSRLWSLGILVNWLGAAELINGIEQQGQVRASTKHRSLTENEYHNLMRTLEQNIRRAITLFEHHNAVRDQAIIHIMLQAGLRVEECTNLDHSDITINERSGIVRVRNGKGSKERVIPLNSWLRAALTQWNELCENTSATALFGGKQTPRLTTRTVQRMVADLGAQIGISDLTPHWLRYTFAKRMETRSVPLEQIRDLLGHTSIETTKKYLRSSLEELQSAVEG